MPRIGHLVHPAKQLMPAGTNRAPHILCVLFGRPIENAFNWLDRLANDQLPTFAVRGLAHLLSRLAGSPAKQTDAAARRGGKFL